MNGDTEFSRLLGNSSQDTSERRVISDEMSNRTRDGVYDSDEENDNGEATRGVSRRNTDEENYGYDDEQSKYDDDDMLGEGTIREFAKRRVWWFFALGMLAILAMHLSFLPRTSVSRDFRRWHGLHFTQPDLQRNFLVFSRINGTHAGVQNEEYLNWWLGNFTEINSRHPFSMTSDDNPELSSYVEKKFQQFGFNPEVVSYNFDDLGRPQSSSVEMLDSSGNPIYKCPMLEGKSRTPAFYGFGVDGDVTGEYVFVNEGSKHDFSLLDYNEISLSNKIAIAKTHPDDEFNNVLYLVKRAEERGAKGVIIYGKSERLNDENLEHSILRGSLASIPYNKNKIPQIPAIPVSYKGIEPVLQSLKGVEKNSAFSKWDFHPIPASSSSSVLRLTTASSSGKARKVTNIIGKIEGAMRDGVVVIGSKRDSMTSSNPSSGHAVMLEIMRNFKKLQDVGWKPMRTIQFVSWDGSSSGNLGVQLMIDDDTSFRNKRSIISYINIDSDAIEGSKFSVDSHPIFNDLLTSTSQYIPFPKKSRVHGPFKSVSSNREFEISDYHEASSDLYSHWLEQDNATINNDLGQPISQSEISIFESHYQIPVVNIKFENNRDTDTAEYLPNSNFYSYDWLKREHVDDQLLLHGSLVRYIGLLTLTIAERDVIHYKTNSFYAYMKSQLDEVLSSHDNLYFWSNETIETRLLNDWSIFSDIQDRFGKVSDMNLTDIVTMVNHASNSIFANSKAFDMYTSNVKDSLADNYPWYKFYKKLHIYAKFKVSNFKLLHLERDMKLVDKDINYLDLEEPPYFDHIVYTASADNNAGTFQHLKDAIENDDFELTVKWLVLIYEKLRKMGKRLA